MAVAYVIEQNTTVNREGERLLIRKEGEVLHALHIFKIEQLVLFGNVFITPAALAYLLEKGIDTVFLSKNGRYRGRLQPALSKNITLRCEQFKKLMDPDFCLKTAREIVNGKLANLRTVLLRLNRTRPGLNLEDEILGLKKLQRSLSDSDNLESVRGYEGRGAVLYFKGLAGGIIDKRLHFSKRVRRPPTDPVNALLSLGYTLLFNTVMAAVSMIGFDPYLGCLHAVDYGRPSLALDLIEEWRPIIIDTLVLSVFNLRVLTVEDFTVGKDIEDLEDNTTSDPLEEMESEPQQTSPLNPNELPVKLTDAGFRKFITQFERKMAEKIIHPLNGQQLSYRDCIREQVRYFARYIRGEEENYQPLLLK